MRFVTVDRFCRKPCCEFEMLNFTDEILSKFYFFHRRSSIFFFVDPLITPTKKKQTLKKKLKNMVVTFSTTSAATVYPSLFMVFSPRLPLLAGYNRDKYLRL